MRFHLLGLAHLPQSKTYQSCAFTQKNRKLAKMLVDLGHEVFFYGPEGSDVLDYVMSSGRVNGKLTFIETHKLVDIAKDYGDGDNRFEIGYDWTTQDFRHDLSGSERKPSTLKVYKECIDYINKVKRPDDFLLCTQGAYHKPIADAVGLFLQCESGIGYRGWSEPMFHAFESSYGQNFLYGSHTPFGSATGRYYDRVIPTYFDLNDYEYGDVKDDYFLFMGRMIKRKGVLTAELATRATGDHLILAGQGACVDSSGYLKDNDPQEYQIAPGNWEYVGYADVEKRKKLMSRAKAVFVATEYLEMFGGVNV